MPLILHYTPTLYPPTNLFNFVLSLEILIVGDSHKGPPMAGENPIFAKQQNINEPTNRKSHPS
jgi:hypothetical protein